MAEPLIIIIEDNQDEELLTIRAIKRSKIDCRILILRSGEEAYEFIDRKGQYKQRPYHDIPHLILLDINLPLASGFAVLSTIRRDPELRLAPVVMFSTSDDIKDVRLAYELGANSYLRKGLTNDVMNRELANAVEYWLKFNLTYGALLE